MLKGQSRELIKEGIQEVKILIHFSNQWSNNIFSRDLGEVGIVKY